jgi:competence protein ComEC
VGQGDCIHIRDGKINILVDGGGSFYSNVGTKILEPYLLKNGITGIDLAFITHADLDHRKGIQELSQRMAIDTLVLSDPYKGDPEAFDDILRRDTVYVSQGDFLAVGSRLSFRILSPEKQVPEGLNDNGLSLVMMLNHSGLDILLTGDLEKAGESNLKNIPTCDILKVAHHGSAGSTSPDFLNAASPAYAAISCGKNNIHGHPAPAVIELLEKSGIIFGRTDQWGALCLRSISPDRFLIENAAREVCWDIKRKDPE